MQALCIRGGCRCHEARRARLPLPPSMEHRGASPCKLAAAGPVTTKRATTGGGHRVSALQCRTSPGKMNPARARRWLRVEHRPVNGRRMKRLTPAQPSLRAATQRKEIKDLKIC
ncbi:uncharacterized protein LOC124699367 [Lolium rigidum]|uniref:uncharacterized protein LOC124699367 n=1 Tax=Lolium rigidum TaxID=89674 RepID=UPI001F5D13CB|nr:uncharacterized protein LOC124699367 [Lolium rigidum]